LASKIAVVGVSGNGKTTLSKRAAAKLGVPYVELDRLNHLPGWVEASPDEIRRSVDEATRGDAWVVDGGYYEKIGTLVYDRADEIVWLDQPLPLVLYRLVKRALVDIVSKRDMFNGNRQTWRLAFWGRDSLVGFAIRMHFHRRREWPARFAKVPTPVTRLRSPREVDRWLAALPERRTSK
jgi:adenylate kinase family enzyme